MYTILLKACYSHLPTHQVAGTEADTRLAYTPAVVTRAHAQGVKQLFCLSVSVVATKVAGSWVCACCDRDGSVDIGLVYVCLELLNAAH